MLAFAGNSLLNRAALADKAIDAGSFTVIRLAAGAAMLVLLMLLRGQAGFMPRLRDAPGGIALCLYAACFSFAYIGLAAASGALLLFAAVQLTMQAMAIARGRVPGLWQMLGLGLAVAGLAWLLGPGADPPPLGAALLMIASGAAWGVYSSLGLSGGNPALATSRNFLFAAPLALLALLFVPVQISAYGAILAVAAGAITSALGYVIWYAVLPQFSATTAGVLQLLVPSIAAIGGVVLLGENLSSRFFSATALIMLGILLTLRKPKQGSPDSEQNAEGQNRAAQNRAGKDRSR